MKCLLHIWPSVQAIADDTGAAYQTVASWKGRGIPPARYGELMALARKRGYRLTFEHLTGEDETDPQLSPKKQEDAA